jgi:5-methylcytosine-specific restriction endonuclease McrA
MSWGGRKVPRIRRQVVELYGTRCWLCGGEIVGTVSVDHVIPRSKGGSDDIDNCRPAHLECNVRRSNRMGPFKSVTSRNW